MPLLHDRPAWQGTDFPSHGAPTGAPVVVVPQGAPESTLPSQ
jgi:hypothetical protein